MNLPDQLDELIREVSELLPYDPKELDSMHERATELGTLEILKDPENMPKDMDSLRIETMTRGYTQTLNELNLKASQ